MPRMMRRAAVMGATAHVASKRGAAKAEAQQAQAAAAAPAPAPAEPVAPAPPAVEPAGPAGSAADSYDDLMKLKGLLDAGVLTQAEFDDQKANLLGA